MFVWNENKLYIRKGNKIVGVDFGADGVVEVEGTELDFSPHMLPIQAFEAKAKFNLTADTPYTFPRPKNEALTVDDNTEPIVEPKEQVTKPATRKVTKKK